MSPSVRTLISCLLPLVLIFIFPLFGVGSGLPLLVFLVLMFLCHVTMMSGHGHGAVRSRDGGRDSGHHEHGH